MTLMRANELKAEARLAYLEWKSLLSHSVKYEFEKRVESSVLYAPMYESAETIRQNVKKISARGNAAKIKVSRILVRLGASVLYKNLAAFEAALKDLVELGKSV